MKNPGMHKIKYKIHRNQYNTIQISISKINKQIIIHVCSFVFIFFLYTCVCVCLQTKSPLRECRSNRSGFCGLPYYCAQPVYVSAVIGGLAVWWHYKPKTKNQKNRGSCRHGKSGEYWKRSQANWRPRELVRAPPNLKPLTEASNQCAKEPVCLRH